MNALILGIVLFAASHLFVMFLPGARNHLRVQLGESVFKGLFSLTSLVGISFMIYGYWTTGGGNAAAETFYTLRPDFRHATMGLVFLGFILVGASHGKGYIKLAIRNPLSLGIGFWATGHLLTTGRRAAVYMFATFLFIAILDIVLSTMRGKNPGYQPRLRSDVIAVLVGLVLYAVFLFGFHPHVLGLRII